MDVTTLFIQLASGIAGSSLAVSGLRGLSLGNVGNVLVGLVGGGLGGQILGSALGTARMTARTGLDPGIVISEIAAGGLGGLMLLPIVGLLHRALVK
jgi:hypothetical protein